MPGKLIYGTRSSECPECEILIWGNFQFCPNCGQPLMIECLHCNIQWRIGQEFRLCPRCGALSPTDHQQLFQKKLV